MEDKRIRKTKRNLKDTLVELLMEVPFEQISITELCKRADISRITFYSHYSDKYALVDEIFADMTEIGTIAVSYTHLLLPRDGKDIRENVFLAFAEQKVPLLTLKTEHVSLETVFMELTQNEDVYKRQL